MIVRKTYKFSGSIVGASGLLSGLVMDKKVGGSVFIQAEDDVFILPVGKLFRICPFIENLPWMSIFDPLRKSLEMPYVMDSENVNHRIVCGKTIVDIAIPVVSWVYSEFSIELNTVSRMGVLLNGIRIACRAELMDSEIKKYPQRKK